jgi:hypothetical protein
MEAVMSNNETPLESSREYSWYEFSLYFSDASKSRNWTQENYDFIKKHVLPTVVKIDIPNFHILNYFDSSKGYDCIRFRVEASTAIIEKVDFEIDRLKQEGLVQSYTKESFNPRQNAEIRIESARKKLEGMLGRPLSNNWKIVGFRDNNMVIDESDTSEYTKKVDAFEAFLNRVLGKWTKLFVEEMDVKPKDKWLFSLFIHLMINSLAYSSPNIDSEEHTMRKIPPL